LNLLKGWFSVKKLIPFLLMVAFVFSMTIVTVGCTQEKKAEEKKADAKPEEKKPS